MIGLLVVRIPDVSAQDFWLASLAEGNMATRDAVGQPWLIAPLPAEDEAA